MSGPDPHPGSSEAARLLRDVPDLSPELAEAIAADLPRQYFTIFSSAERARHVRTLLDLSLDAPVRVYVEPAPRAGEYAVTFIAFDCPGEFSWITGFLAAAGADVVRGDVFTVSRTPAASQRGARRRHSLLRRPRRTPPAAALQTDRAIIDVFIVTGRIPPPDELASRLEQDLSNCFRAYPEGGPEAGLRFVNSRVAEHLLSRRTPPPEVLLPLSIQIRNDSARQATRVTVRGQDTPAFLYCLSNALAASAFYIEAVRIRTVDHQVSDTFWVTDLHRNPLTDRESRNRLRIAILVTKQFSHFLGSAADPFQALMRFNRLLSRLDLDEKAIQTLLCNPGALRDLANVLGAGAAFWESFVRLQYENLLPLLGRSRRRNRLQVRTREEWAGVLREAAAGCTSYEETVEAINRAKDEALARIELEFILDPDQDLDRLGLALTGLAEALVEVLLETANQRLIERYGAPVNFTGRPCAFCVMGLGKLGGCELGFASDLELLCVFSEDGRTNGPEPIRASEFFARLATLLRDGVRARPDGIFHVDMRLRPYGNDGPIACSMETFCRYYGPGGAAHDYERQALVKMRLIAGSEALGRRIEAFRDEILYQSHLVDYRNVEALRKRQQEELVPSGRINAKYSAGGLVDIEYTIQYLQILHGHLSPDLRTPSTREAINALVAHGVLSPADGEGLVEAYDFLRRLVNALRMLRGHARELELPDEQSLEFVHLARRMGYKPLVGMSAPEQLRRDLGGRMAFVRDICRRYLGRSALVTRQTGTLADVALAEDMPADLVHAILQRTGFRDPARAAENLRRLARQSGDRDVFCQLIVLAEPVLRQSPDCDMALNNWERFVSAVISPRGFHESLLREPLQLEFFLRIVASSQYLADTLVRHPEYFGWLLSPDELLTGKTREDFYRDVYNETVGLRRVEHRLDALRRCRARHLLRIGTRDLCLQAPFVETVHELSWLAMALIDAVFRIEAGTIADAERLIDDGMLVVLALGKLGGQELNYSSDADLLFYLRDGRENRHDEAAHETLTRLCRRTIRSLIESTPAGRLYRVDMRLRPFGRSGVLLPTEEGVQAYFAKAARPIEFQALLKACPIIGGDDVVQRIRELLLLGRRRFSPAEFASNAETVRTRGLRHAVKAARAEGGRIDIKTGAGGIRDIEFGVQLLQLCALPAESGVLAGATLDAIDKLEHASVLDADTARIARESYVLLRRVEHLLQIMHDRQVHTLDMSPAHLDALARRLRPDAPDGARLASELNAAMSFSREFFQRACARCRA